VTESSGSICACFGVATNALPTRLTEATRSRVDGATGLKCERGSRHYSLEFHPGPPRDDPNVADAVAAGRESASQRSLALPLLAHNARTTALILAGTRAMQTSLRVARLSPSPPS
jgi:hypothetical protein